jgi:hypothetical protein
MHLSAKMFPEPNMRKNRFVSIVSYMVLLAFLFSCTFTTTKHKDPTFTTSLDSITNDITSLVVCENISLDGTEVITNGHSSGNLSIQLINSRNLPTDSSEITSIEKRIAKEIKDNLKDKNEYDTYSVYFISKETKGVVMKTNSTGYIFESKDL